jgi:type III secretion system YopN/LcrE/InvE/MxiC family regulator
MPISSDILPQTIATFNVQSPVGAEVMENVRGNRGGEVVKIADEASKISDATEELGMSHGHHGGEKLEKREVRQGSGANLEALSRIADYYDKLPDMPREVELQSLVETLQQFQELLEGKGKEGGGKPTKEDILAALQKFDGDVTHQYAALEVAREYFEAAGASAEFEKTDMARDVKAGFAAAEVASKAAQTLETDPAAVRDTYRAMLREQKNMGQLFDALAKFDVLKNFSQVVETFLTAAGHDLSSTGPSTDEGFLQALLTELGKLKKLQTVFEGVKQLVATSERLFAASERGQMKTVDVASAILNFVSKAAVNLGDARGLLGGLRNGRLASQLAFANGVFNLHGEIPDDVMPSPQARQQQKATLMSLLEELVKAEENEYGAA